MSNEYQNILKSAMALPKNEFFALVQALLAKLQDQISDEPQNWSEEELLKVLDERIKSVESGELSPIRGEEVMSSLKKRIA